MNIVSVRRKLFERSSEAGIKQIEAPEEVDDVKWSKNVLAASTPLASSKLHNEQSRKRLFNSESTSIQSPTTSRQPSFSESRIPSQSSFEGMGGNASIP